MRPRKVARVDVGPLPCPGPVTVVDDDDDSSDNVSHLSGGTAPALVAATQPLPQQQPGGGSGGGDAGSTQPAQQAGRPSVTSPVRRAAAVDAITISDDPDDDGDNRGDQAATRATAAAASGQQAAAPAGGASSDDEGGSDNCIICLELMSEEGSHRPASLKCGHLFGKDCVLQWLKTKRSCPQCNASARASDVRVLYNVPKRVAAGSGASSAALEQELRVAREAAQREQQRARDLQRQLQLLQQQVAQQGRQQLPGAPRLTVRQLKAQQRQQAQAQAQAQEQQEQQQRQQPAIALAPADMGELGAVFEAARAAAGGGYDGQQPHAQHPAAYVPPHLLPLGVCAPYAAVLDPLLPHAAPAAVQEAIRQRFQMQQHAMQMMAARVQQAPAPVPPAAAAGAAAAARQSAAAAAAAAAMAAATAVMPAAAAAANGSGGGAPRSSSGGRQLRGCRHVALLPSPCAPPPPPAAAGTESSYAAGAGCVGLAGCFEPLQEFELNVNSPLPGSRAFYLDAPGARLLMAEGRGSMIGPPSQQGSRLRQVSMYAPNAHSWITLPAGCGPVRAMSGQQPCSSGSGSGGDYVAVVTAKAGVQLAKLSSGNIVHSIPAPAGGLVWSVAWSSTNDQQLLLGCDRGRMALADLRMSSSGSRAGSSSFVALTGDSGGSGGGGGSSRPSQPLLSVATLPPSFRQQQQQQQHVEAGEDVVLAEAEALAACSGGVLAWSSSQPDAFQPLLSSAALGSGTCESLALHPSTATVVASFRAPLSATPPPPAAAAAAAGAHGVSAPVHVKAQLAAAPPAPAADGDAQAAAAAAPAAAAAAASGGSCGVSAAVLAGQRQLLSSTLCMRGHSSAGVMTHGCFLPPLPDLPHEPLLFASADEASHEPRVWGCASGAQLLQAAPWRRLSSPVVQLSGGVWSGVVLLGALAERELVLYHYRLP